MGHCGETGVLEALYLGCVRVGGGVLPAAALVEARTRLSLTVKANV